MGNARRYATPGLAAARAGQPLAGVVAELSGIEEEYQGWHPWVSDGGRCWATRKGPRPVGAPGGWAMTVDADTPDGLRQEIAAQERLAELIVTK